MGRKSKINDDDKAREAIVISAPEELIASVPAMLGFPPEAGSVVVVCGRTASADQGPVIRIDAHGLLGLDDTHSDYMGLNYSVADIDTGPARVVAEYCARENVESVHLVIVHEGCADDYSAALRAKDTAAVFEYSLEQVGTTVLHAYGVGEFARGSAWSDLFGMVSGVQLDPGSTQIAAKSVFDGRSQANSREEVESLYLVRDHDAIDVDNPDIGKTRLRSRGVGRAVAGHEKLVRHLEAGEQVSDDELETVGLSLLETAVRDKVYESLARRDLGADDGRRALWWSIARRRPPRERSVALLLLGVAAYYEGSGVHARAALEAALEADPANTLADLLVESLDRGLSPDRIRSMAAAA